MVCVSAHAAESRVFNWSHPDYGIELTLEGPYLIVLDNVVTESDMGGLMFVRETKDKSGTAQFTRIDENTTPHHEFGIEDFPLFETLPEAKIFQTEAIKVGDTPATLHHFSYRENDRHQSPGTGYMLVSDLNGFQYIVIAMKLGVGDATRDAEFEAMLKTLRIFPVEDESKAED